MAEQLLQQSNVRSYELPPSRAYRMSKGFTVTLAILLVLIVLLALMSPCGGGMGRGQANRAKSSSNMHQIGLALIMYSNGDPLGRFAPDLPTLITTQQLSADVFVPSTNDTRALGNTPAEQATNLMKGGYESYIYVGATLTNQGPPDTISLYEPLAANKNLGSNVLFGDGHVEFLQKPAIDQIIAMDKSGVRPIYWPPHPAMQPSTRP